MAEELESFKTSINLSGYAAAQGYELQPKETSRNSVVMKHPNGDKVVIARGLDGHWVYFSVRDDRDNGSIIDFVQQRQHCSLGSVRIELRPWVNGMHRYPAPTRYVAEVERSTKDRQALLMSYEKTQPVSHHRYLEQDRYLSSEVLENRRFAGRIRMDARSNAIFPHYDRDGLSGYEIKNFGFTGFSKGGDKGLWFSAANKGDTRLVLTESAIDAISYHTIHPHDYTRYASVGGALNASQPNVIRAAMDKMPDGSEIVLAFDNDEGGDDLTNTLQTLAQELDRPDLTTCEHSPPERGKDWNDVLQYQIRNVQGPLFGR